MRSVRRILAAACLLAAVLGLLAGCHGRQEQAAFSVPEKFDESRSYEITFWAKNDTNKSQTDIYKKAIEDFQTLYPNITVTLRLYTNYGDIYNDVITNISTQTTPNVCITYPDHIATYLTGDNVVVPLDELMADERYGLGGSEVRFDVPSQEEIVPQFLEECRLEGHYYALPYMRSTEACYVNKTYVEALGYELPEVLTWDFVWEVSRAGEDNDTYYDVKLQAVQLLLSHMDDTFITPVFNGSASLRDAAGQLIEGVTKAVRRGQTVDDAFLETLYSDTQALYHLDSISPSGGEADLGPLPGTAVALLVGLAVAWVLILGYLALQWSRERKKRAHLHKNG